MKRSTACLSLLFVLLLLIFSGCNKPAANSSGAANTASSNTSQAKTPKVYQDMPPAIMNSEMKGLDGKQFTLKAYEGKVVLVNLWATWCGPCRMEMPELIKLQDEYRDKGLVIIGLDTDDEPVEMVKTFVERQQLNYPIGWTSDEVRNGLLNISRAPAIPQSFILTTDGKLAGLFKGYNPSRTPADVRKTIDEILSRTSE